MKKWYVITGVLVLFWVISLGICFNVQTQLSAAKGQISSLQTQLSSLHVSSIDIVLSPSLGNQAFGPAKSGLPTVNYGDSVQLYGTGFIVGEDVTFRISDGNHSFEIGSIRIDNPAGVFLWSTVAKWQNYNWTNDAMYFGCIKAVGNKGSMATAFIGIWAR